MSLKEEIENIVLSCHDTWEDGCSTKPETVDNIMKAIEKRIDEMMIKPKQQVKFAREYNGIDEDADMRLRVLNEVKELLK